MLYLASASPRRRELLDLAGIPYTTAPANADERFADGTPPEEAVRLLARRKAEAVSQFPEAAGRTIVVNRYSLRLPFSSYPASP